MLKRLFIATILILLMLGAACQQVDKTSATLHGKLLVKDIDIALPALDNAIYLVPLPTDQTVMSVPTIDANSAVQAKVDNTSGKFVFSKVKPGKYIVMVITTSSSQIPAHMDDGSLAIVQVKDTDLGKNIDLKYFVIP